MIICLCSGVSDSTIREMLKHTDLEGVKQLTGACQNCHTCCDALEEIAREHEQE